MQPTSQHRPYVVAVDPSPLFLDGLEVWLSDDGHPVIHVDSAHAAFAEFAAMPRGLYALVAGPNLSDEDILGLCRWATTQSAQTVRVIVLSTGSNSKPFQRRLAATGVWACLSHKTTGPEIREVVNNVLAGRAQFSLAGVDMNTPEPVASLSPRESRLVHLLALGRTNDEIARELGTNLATVNLAVATIVTKISAQSRDDVVRLASSRGLV